MYNSVFKANETADGIVGSSSVTTLGGVVYVGMANNVEVDNCTFQQVSSVGSGGGLYINSSNGVDIKNSVFNQIVVNISGGVFFFFCCYCIYLLFYYIYYRGYLFR
jgi:hypothetical protein